MSSNETPNNAESQRVRLKVTLPNTRHMLIEVIVERTTTVNTMKQTYCELFGLPLQNLYFQMYGLRLMGTDTVETMGMVSNDVITVIIDD